LAVLAGCTLLLSACQVRSWLDVDLSGGESGDVTAVIGFDEEFRNAIAEMGGGADLLGEIENDAPDQGWSVERFTDGAVEGITLTRSFASIEELSGILSEGVGSGPQEGLLEDLRVIDKGDTIRFEAGLPGAADSPVGGMDLPSVEGMLEVDGRIQVTFAGEVLDHNGDLDGRTVTWTFDALEASESSLFAEARKGGGFPWVAVIGVLLGLGLVGLIAWRVLGDRNIRFKVVSPLQRLEHQTPPPPQAMVPVEPAPAAPATGAVTPVADPPAPVAKPARAPRSKSPDS
jgi:hypothetical protein